MELQGVLRLETRFSENPEGFEQIDCAGRVVVCPGATSVDCASSRIEVRADNNLRARIVSCMACPEELLKLTEVGVFSRNLSNDGRLIVRVLDLFDSDGWIRRRNARNLVVKPRGCLSANGRFIVASVEAFEINKCPDHAVKGCVLCQGLHPALRSRIARLGDQFICLLDVVQGRGVRHSQTGNSGLRRRRQDVQNIIVLETNVSALYTTRQLLHWKPHCYVRNVVKPDSL